jgi:hypothetical protein
MSSTFTAWWGKASILANKERAFLVVILVTLEGIIGVPWSV